MKKDSLLSLLARVFFFALYALLLGCEAEARMPTGKPLV